MPTARLVVVKVATPWAFNWAWPILAPACSNTTVPVGVAVALVTTAVKVAGSPASVVVAGELRVVTVAVERTTSSKTVDALVA